MNTEQILEGNKMILEFMGGSILFDGSIHTCPRGGNNKFHDGTTGRKGVNELKYHSSWDWLMPIVKKIYDHLQNIERPSKNHCCKGDMLEVDITCQIREINILKTHEAVVEWIKWYNTQNQEPLTNNL